MESVINIKLKQIIIGTTNELTAKSPLVPTSMTKKDKNIVIKTPRFFRQVLIVPQIPLLPLQASLHLHQEA